MRIKLATSLTSSTVNCWFVVSEKHERQTVHQLRKKIVQDLNLNVEPSNIQLLMDGFNLLPQTIIKDLVRDGDLITVKEDKHSLKPVIKKRKASVEENHDLEEPILKKAKKAKKAKNITVKEKKSKEKELKKVLKKKSKGEETKEKPETKKLKVTVESLPFEGIPRTKKRNMRRRLLKQQLRATNNVAVETPIPVTTIDTNHHELQVQNLAISNVDEPLQLIKKNKNKKRNHLKEMNQRSHVHYTPDQITNVEEPKVTLATVTTATTTTTVLPDTKNPYGRAFVTFVESERNYKGRNNTSKYSPKEYPIHRVPTLFYADQGLAQEEIAYQLECEAPVAIEEETHVIEETPVVKRTEKPINYEQDFPEANFTDKLPSIGDKLAIKTLELTAAYTPEISDWKQVRLIDLNQAAGQVTFEFMPGFGKATTKGGKFDNRKNKKKRYDDWCNEEEEEAEEEEEEEEEIEEQSTTFEITDIFTIRNMSAK